MSAPSQNNWNSRRVESELWDDSLSGSSVDVALATPPISIEVVSEPDRGWEDSFRYWAPLYGSHVVARKLQAN